MSERINCKECGKELTKDLINNNRDYCSRRCRKAVMSRNPKRKHGLLDSHISGRGVFDVNGNSV